MNLVVLYFSLHLPLWQLSQVKETSSEGSFLQVFKSSEVTLNLSNYKINLLFYILSTGDHEVRHDAHLRHNRCCPTADS